MDDNTNRTVSTVVGGLTGNNGHFVLLIMLAILAVVGIAGFSYIFLQALEKQASTCAAENTQFENKLDTLNKTLGELTLRFELLNQRRH